MIAFLFISSNVGAMIKKVMKSARETMTWFGGMFCRLSALFMKSNTMMIFVNDLYKFECKSKKALLPLAQLLQPFAPHSAEEIWNVLGGSGLVVTALWPTFNPALCIDNTVTMGVQVNGKMRGTIEITLTTDEKTAVSEALKITTVVSALAGKNPSKVIYKAGKILNMIVPN